MISYRLQGRFANNIFQYMAAKVLQKYASHHPYVYNMTLPSAGVVNHDNYETLYNTLYNDQPHVECDLFLDGFFQFEHHLNRERRYLQSIWTVYNQERFNDTFRVCDIANYTQENKLSHDPDDLLLHVRLDDFIPIHWTIEPSILHRLIKQIPHRRLYILCDQPKSPLEFTYLQSFHSFQPIYYLGRDLLEDFNEMYHAPRLICSRSTLSWVSAFLGEIQYPNKEVWFPLANEWSDPDQTFCTPVKNTHTFECNPWYP